MLAPVFEDGFRRRGDAAWSASNAHRGSVGWSNSELGYGDGWSARGEAGIEDSIVVILVEGASNGKAVVTDAPSENHCRPTDARDQNNQSDKGYR